MKFTANNTTHNANKKGGGYSQFQMVQSPSSTRITGVDTMTTTTTPKLMNLRGEGENPLISRSNSDFDTAATIMYDKILQNITHAKQNRNEFVLEKWTHQTTGGLYDEDRVLLAKYYRNANSVFEYGLGESTYIANHVGVPRYAGIDSDVAYVDGVRQNTSSHFRFYYGDLGDTEAWGMPIEPNLPKAIWQYQVAPLQSELLPFDVYMVDGRYRVACVLLSFLHASSRGAPADKTIVLMHDCNQPGHSPPNWHQTIGVRHYTVNDDILQLKEHSGKSLCVYQRKPSTTDTMLLERYQKYGSDPD
ncbi:MAG: hypothetical protein SGARI_002306 [Bacillariaceae sp.]